MRTAVMWCSLVVLTVAVPAAGVVCQPDVVPAATLLIPYFEVDLTDPSGTTTLFTVVNAARDPVLTQVNIFSDGGVPIVGFWVYLQGYDVQAVNLRDVLANGYLPVTGPFADSPGPLSGSPVFFPGCESPYAVGPSTIDAMFLQAIQMQLTGQPSLYDGTCAGIDHGDDVARGYVTVDVVQQCSMYLPNELDYQLDALGMNNVLLGDWMIVDPWNNFEQAFAAVHVEADVTRFGVDDRTFYGEYNTIMSAADRREPLPSTWQARFDGFDDAELLVWRGVPGTGSRFHCALGPSWYPLPAANSSGGYGPLILFDDEDVAMAPAAGELTFPAATQRVSVSGPEVGFVTAQGQAYLNLQHWASLPVGGQAWVGVISRSEGRFATGIEATALDSSCSAAPVTIVPTGPRAENPWGP